MAYAPTTNPPNLVGGVIAGTPKKWMYQSTHSTTEVVASGFFSDGYSRGMRVNDLIDSIQTSTGTSQILSSGLVTVASSSGPVTVSVTS